MALGHGLQDAQKTMGVIFLALLTGGYVTRRRRPAALGDRLAPPRAISLGTYSGGWRIMRTLGRRIIHLDPARGFAAESVGATVLYTTAFVFQAPISTTHTITSAIMGVGRHQALLRRPLGRGPLDPDRLGPHLPRRRPRRRRLLRRSSPRPRLPLTGFVSIVRDDVSSSDAVQPTTRRRGLSLATRQAAGAMPQQPSALAVVQGAALRRR